MEYRKFCGKDISLLGLGLMRLPKLAADKEEIDYAEAEKIVDLAYQNGVNYFDTAWFYHGGDSEKFVRQALGKYPRDSFYLATKMPTPLLETKEDMAKYFDEQLRRTGMEYFDFYLCHCLSQKLFDKMVELDLFAFLEEKKAQGKIRHIGFSFHDKYPVLETICAAYPWEFVQIQLNYLDWELYNSKEQYEILQKYSLPAIIMEPIRGGRLADLGPKANAVLKAAEPDKSVASWAMRYAAGFEGVFTVLSGMSDIQQVADNCATFAAFSPLSEGEAATLEAAKQVFKESATIPCTACRYCVPCPLGVSIPELFALYNETAFSGSMEAFVKKYAEFPAEENAALCAECGSCTAMCPQQLDIPALLHKLDAGETPV